MRKIGIFGGTFDPVHMGHLILAEQCREQGKLDQVWFLPSASPPHKQGQSITRFEQRVEMLALALAGNPAFRIEEIESHREGPSYTADTLAELKQHNPDTELWLLLGTDSLLDLPQWYQPERILQQAGLLVMHRPEYHSPSEEELGQAFHFLPKDAPIPLQWVLSPPLIDIASSDLRKRVSEGRSIRYLVPAAVECYIREKQLYR